MKVISDTTKQYYVIEASSKECGKLYEFVRTFNMNHSDCIVPPAEVLRAEQGNVAIIVNYYLVGEWDEAFEELVKSSSE